MSAEALAPQPETPMYVELEGDWHPIDDNEHTPCGLLIPPLTLWTRETPKRIHCGPDATPKGKSDQAASPPKKGKKK
jgi:hypothetical protein